MGRVIAGAAILASLFTLAVVFGGIDFLIGFALAVILAAVIMLAVWLLATGMDEP